MTATQEKLKKLQDELSKDLVDLISSENLDSKISACESILISEPKNIKAKSEWIWHQSEANKVPVSALVSPLQELTILSIPESEIPLMIATICKIAGLLIEKKQNRLALAVIETADSLSSNREYFSDQQTLVLKEVLLELYQAESAGAVMRREPKSYFESLEKKISEIQTELKKLQKRKAPTLEKKIVKETTKPTEQIIETDIPDTKSESSDPIIEDLKSAFAEKVSQKSNNWVYAVILLVLVGVFLFRAKIFSVSDFSFNEAVAVSTPETFPEILKPLIPQPQLRDDLKIAKGMVDDKLSKIDDRIKNLNFDKGSADSDIDQEALEKAETKIDKEVSSVENVEPERSPEIDKVEEKVVPGKTPMLDPDRLAKRKLESLGSTIPGNDLRMGPDGRVYGPPVDKNNAPLGAPSYPVEQFDPPLVFKTIVDTKVLSAPSMVSSEVAFLRRGSKIQVVVKMDRWLEIRSNGGRKGYIFAQDAVPAN